MGYKYLGILLFLAAVFLSCSNRHDCPDCFTPPESLYMRIISANTSTDLICNGTYSVDSLLLYYKALDTIQIVDHEVLIDSSNSKAIFISHQISWESAAGFKEFFLHLNENEVDTIYLNVEEYHSECCTYFNWNNFEINGDQPIIDTIDNVFIYAK